MEGRGRKEKEKEGSKVETALHQFLRTPFIVSIVVCVLHGIQFVFRVGELCTQRKTVGREKPTDVFFIIEFYTVFMHILTFFLL